MLDNLGPGVRLTNATGVTHLLPPVGSPFFALNLAGASVLAPGGTITADLQFSSRSAGKIRFTTRVLAGTTQV